MSYDCPRCAQCSVPLEESEIAICDWCRWKLAGFPGADGRPVKTCEDCWRALTDDEESVCQECETSRWKDLAWHRHAQSEREREASELFALENDVPF